MHPVDRKKIEQTISMLQEVIGQKGSTGNTIPKIVIPAFDQEISTFVGISQNLEA